MLSERTPDYSFVNNFWDKDEHGVAAIANKFTNAKHTFEELHHFYKERIQLEEEYGRRLNTMTRKAVIGAAEENNVSLFFESLRLETDQMSKSHSTQADLISNEVYKPLENFMSSFKARKRTIESTISKIVKYKKALAVKMEQLRAKYESECLRFRAMSADKLLLDGNELRKLMVKLEKTEHLITVHRQEYYDIYKDAVEIHERFVREWKLALVKYEELEEERIKFLRSNVWTYCNLVSITCVNVDTSCENIRVVLEKCESKREVELFTKKYGTGNQIPGLPKFIDYITSTSSSDMSTQEPPSKANFDMNALPSTDSYATVKITKKPPPKEPSEQTNALLVLGKRSDETRQEFRKQLEEEYQTDQPEARIISSLNTVLNPPRSEQSSEQSASQSNSHSSSCYPQSSHYTDETHMSLHNESTFSGKGQHWNSPQRRRRSRGSFQALSDYSSSYETTRSRPKSSTFVLQKEEDVQIDDEDILRSTLRDLQLGGNGDMNTLKKSIRPKSMVMESHSHSYQPPKLSNKQVQRPKSMLQDNHVSWSKVTEHSQVTPEVNQLPKIAPITGRPVLKYCKAIYSYKAKEEDECSFKKRDIVLVLDDGDLWWSIEVLGKPEVGQAPSNYLAPI